MHDPTVHIDVEKRKECDTGVPRDGGLVGFGTRGSGVGQDTLEEEDMIHLVSSLRHLVGGSSKVVPACYSNFGMFMLSYSSSVR